MKRIKYIVFGMSITIVLILVLYFLLVSLGLSRYVYSVIALLLLLSGVYISVYIQKLQKPHCETCKRQLKFVSKEKLEQSEEIRNGKFVFINTYHYQYRCNHCKKDIEITKKVKMK